MKTLLLALCLTAPLLAAVAAPDPKPADAPRYVPPNVRIELLVVDLPQERALALLPELRDDAKIEGAYQKILASIQSKEATLVGYPILQTVSGQKATSETIDEMIYPTQFQPPTFGPSGGGPAPDASEPWSLAACPTGFEKRNLGVTLEIEPVVGPSGKWIDLNLQPQHVVFQGLDWYECGKNSKTTAALSQPRFFTTKVSTSFRVRSGQWKLCEFHKLLKPEGQIELFLIQATAVPPED